MKSYVSNVNVSVEGILLTTNEGIAYINIGKGYSIEKIENLKFKIQIGER